MKIISLVPSITESLFDLGLGSDVVGVTDYCVLPDDANEEIPKVGGPKKLDLEKIRAIKPDIIFANQEENARGDIQFLIDSEINVKLFFPKTPRNVISDLYDLLGICGNLDLIEVIRALEKSLEWVEAAHEDRPIFRYFCPIWVGKHEQAGDWWMTFNQDTYPAALLKIFRGENIFAARARKYPLNADLGYGESEPAGERDTRYPCITGAEISQNIPDIILIPDEPYSYNLQQIDQILDLFREAALPLPKVVSVDGSLLFWPGTRLAKALLELPELLES